MWKPDPNVLTQQTDEGTILLNLSTDQFYALSLTAGRFWELLSDGILIDEIEQKLLSEFEVDAALLKTEIESLLLDLAEKGMVDRADNRH